MKGGHGEEKKNRLTTRCYCYCSYYSIDVNLEQGQSHNVSMLENMFYKLN